MKLKKQFIYFITFLLCLLLNQSWGQVSITTQATYQESFDGMGTSGTATLPTGFKFGNNTTDWTAGANTTATTLAYGTTGTGAVTGTSSGGAINWANGITGSSTERAIGYLTTSSFSSPRDIFFAFTNNTGSTISTLIISWDYEKYRSGSRAFDWTFFHGSTASSVSTSATAGDQSYSADADNNTINNPPTIINKAVLLTGLSIGNGTTYYFRWRYAGSGGSTNAQGLAIDNLTLTFPQNIPYSQNFGTTSFTTYPAGFYGRLQDGSSVSSQSAAEATTPVGGMALLAAQSGAFGSEPSGGLRGFAVSSNGQLAISTANSTTSGLNQPFLTINTGSNTSLNISYDVEILFSGSRTMGHALQYRTGVSGSWTTVSATATNIGSSPILNSTTSISTSLSGLSTNTNYQFRWITWRDHGSGTTNTSIGIDNISFTAGATPTITLNNNTQITAGNVNQGTTDHILSRFRVEVATANATLNQISFTAGGTFIAGDITNFKLYTSTTNTFPGGTPLATVSAGSIANGGTVTFSSLSQSCAIGDRYFWITADVSATATASNTVSVPSLGASNFTFAAGMPTGTIDAGGAQTFVVVTPNIVLSSPAASSADITQGQNNQVIYRFDLAVTVANASLNGVTVTTAGTYAAADLTNIKCWYSADNSFDAGTDVLLSTKTTGLGAGSQVFPSFTSQTINSGSTGFIFITVDLPLTATSGNTISVNAITTADISFVSGSKSGTANTSGTKTIIACTPTNVTGLSLTPGNGQITVSWTNPSCMDDVVIAVHTASISASPSGVPTISSLSYTDGANPTLTGGAVLVYRGSTSPQTITSLTNGTTYFVKVFTRRGTVYSSGVESSATPSNITVGDYRSNKATGNWGTAADWDTWNGTSWVTASSAPTSTTNVTVQNGHTYTIPGSGTLECNNLTVDAGGKLFYNTTGVRYISINGNITCNGTIGNGTTLDGISFNINGASCTISGSGSFDCLRLRKNSTTPATTNLTISMNVNARFNGTAIYNEVAATFNVTIASGVTVTCPGDGTSNSRGSVSIDGTEGTGSGERSGTLTVNGTLTLSGTGTGTATLFAKTNNSTGAVAIVIASTGTINTNMVDFGASSAAGHTFTINSGGILNITGEPATFITPSNTNNTYSFNANSNINYSRAGDQTIYTFGETVFCGNITLSGSGVKKVPAGRTLNFNGTLTTGGLLTLESTSSGTARIGALTTGTITGNVTIERFIPSSVRAWRYMAAPFTTGPTVASSWQQQIHITGNGTGGTNCPSLTQHTNGFDASVLNNPSMMTFNETVATSTNSFVNGYQSIANTNATNLTAGTGYIVFVRGARSQGCALLDGTNPTPSAVTISATGAVHQGTFNFTGITYTAANGQGWNLVGNPFPSNINWDASGWTRSNIDGTVYLYVPATNTFTSWNGTTGTNGATDGIIPSSGAFFIKANASSPAMSITENVKTASNPGLGLFKKHELDNAIEIAFRNTTGAVDETKIVFSKFYENKYGDDFDGEKLHNLNNLNIYSIVEANTPNAKKCVFNGLEPIEPGNSTVIPLGITTPANGNYILSINVEKIAEKHVVWLVDHYLKTQTLLTGTLNIPVTINSDPASKGDSRFEIVVKHELNVLSEPIVNATNNTVFNVYPNPAANVLNIAATYTSGNAVTVNIYDAFGKKVLQHILEPKAGNTANGSMEISNLQAGTYFVEVSNGETKNIFKTIKY
ncbi:MAG: T9SS type A sorting domain-containing protein [Bacteroidia bacterium]